MAKAEVVEFMTRSVRRRKDWAQQIVDDIERNKCAMTNTLGGASVTCDEAEWVLTTIQSSDVDLLYADKPSYLVAQIMDCVLLMFQRPLNTVEMDVHRRCIKPSWNESLKVRNLGCL